MPDYSLVMPLRIPTGWAVRYNGFFEAENPGLLESQDLLWLEQVDSSTGVCTGLFVDLGWYGSREEGTFRLLLLKDDWDHILERFESRDRLAIVHELERWLLTAPR
jgi:hypothetical protein